MNRRILVIEPDASIRRMMERALGAAGFAPTSVPTIEASRAVLDGKPIEVAIVELRATNADGVEGVRALRADFPELPLIVTGTLLTPRVMQDLVRARVDDVVPKPFTPRELVGAVQRVLRETRTRNDGAMEYAAAMAAARRAIVEGRLRDTASPLERARAVSPLDGEAMAMLGLVRELEGADEEAARAYRASLALQDERVTDEASPREGLARLSAYAGAHVTPTFEHRGRKALWFVRDPVGELPLGPPAAARVDVVVFALGLGPNELGASYSRAARDGAAFLIASGTMTERLVLRVARTFDAPKILAHPSTLAHIGAAIDEIGRSEIARGEAP